MKRVYKELQGVQKAAPQIKWLPTVLEGSEIDGKARRIT